MYQRGLIKADGRRLTLYGRRPIPAEIEAPSPSRDGFAPNSHVRWHPLRGEWVAYASHRQDRTFLPPAAYNPLVPTTDPASPTEVPAGDWDVAVFENLFPTFTAQAHDPPSTIVDTRPGRLAATITRAYNESSTMAARVCYPRREQFARRGARDGLRRTSVRRAGGTDRDQGRRAPASAGGRAARRHRLEQQGRARSCPAPLDAVDGPVGEAGHAVQRHGELPPVRPRSAPELGRGTAATRASHQEGRATGLGVGDAAGGGRAPDAKDKDRAAAERLRDQLDANQSPAASTSRHRR